MLRMINYCYIVKNIAAVSTRVQSTKMDPSKKSNTVLAADTDDLVDENRVYFANLDALCVAESEDLFAEDSHMSLEAQHTIDVSENSSAVRETDPLQGTTSQYMSLAANQTIDLCTETDPLEGSSGQNVTPRHDWISEFLQRHPDLPPACPKCLVAAKGLECCVHDSEVTKTDPKQGPSGKTLKISCEDFLKYSTSDDDSDKTPDLDVGLLLSKCKRDNSEKSKEQGEVEESWVNLKKRVESNECENGAHSLNEMQESDESDVTILSDTIAVDSFNCHNEDCDISHTARYVREPDTHTEEHETPSLDEFMESTASLTGCEVFGLLSFYAHRLRACKAKLLQEYTITPHIVNRWMDML